MSDKTITFYDIASKVGAWSPNTWKTRFVLNYKQLPYKTEWVSLPDIQPFLKSIGAKPAAGGGRVYTLPVISIPSDDGGPPTIVEDSGKIAAYLDKEYPEHPLFPEGSHAIQGIVIDWLASKIMYPETLSFPLTPPILDERAAEYFRESRKKWHGKDVDEYATPGPEREAAWAFLEKGFGGLASMLDQNAGEPEDEGWLTCHQPIYADFAIISLIIWFKKIGGEEGWARIRSWHGGRWAKLLEKAQPWMKED